MPILAFDLQTIPDIASLRILHGVDAGVSDGEVAEMAFQINRQNTGDEVLPPHLQRVVAIGCVLRLRQQLKVWSLDETDENSLIQRFFDGIEKYTPQLVSRNGRDVELPVLHYRGLIQGVVCPRYWEQGERDKNFQQNNYLHRDHPRHLDLSDMLAKQATPVPLAELAQLLGLPVKLETSAVWTAYQHGQLAAIRQTSEARVLNTYLLFTRWQQMRGALSRAEYQQECERVRAELRKLNQAHCNAYLAAWDAA